MTNNYTEQGKELMYEIVSGVEYVDAYLRYSSKNQDDGVSIEMQIDDINAYCAKHNLVVRKWYIDKATSASKKAAETRDSFFELIQDIKSGSSAGILLVYSTSRAFRNSYESHKYRNLLREHNIKLMSATQHIDEDTSSGRLTTSILSDIDQYKAEELSDYVSSAIRHLVKRGYWTGAPVPLGYKVVPTTDENGKPRKMYAIDENTADYVKDVFRWYIDGLSPSMIADRLDALGVKTSRGNTYNPDAVRVLLANDFYIGTRRLQMKDQDEIVLENAVPAIIDVQTYSLAQQVRKERRASSNPKPKRKKAVYLLTGKIVCGECQKREQEAYMAGKSSSGRKYYACKNKTRYKACACKNINKEDLESYVLRQIKTRILDESLIETISDEVLSQLAKFPQPVADEKALRKRKSELLVELVNLAKMKAKNEIDAEVYALTKKDFDDEKAQVELDLHAIEQNKKNSIDREFVVATIRSMIADVETGSPELLKAIFDRLVDSVTITNDKVVVSLVLHFTRSALKPKQGNPKFAISAEIARKNIKG